MTVDVNLAAYIREIDIVTQTWISEAKSYAKYRAIGIGFTRNVDWLQITDPPTISFFNGVTAMLELALVMSIWKMTERLKGKDDRHRPGEIFTGSAAAKRRTHDEIRSLPRAAFLFRDAFSEDMAYGFRYSERQSEISEQFNLPPREAAGHTEKISEDRECLLNLCKQIDELTASKACESLDIVRNQGFAHSSEISRASISQGLDPDALNFTRANLFEFGDAVMQVALDFEARWSQRARATMCDLISQNAEIGEGFWKQAKRGFAPDMLLETDRA